MWGRWGLTDNLELDSQNQDIAADTCQSSDTGDGFWLVSLWLAARDNIGAWQWLHVACCSTRQVGSIFQRAHQRCYYTSLPDKCLWKEEFGFHSAAPDQPGPAHSWGLLLHWVWFCSGCSSSGGLWGLRGGNVKIIIQPQIKSLRFINTSSAVRKLGSARGGSENA